MTREKHLDEGNEIYKRSRHLTSYSWEEEERNTFLNRSYGVNQELRRRKCFRSNWIGCLVFWFDSISRLRRRVTQSKWSRHFLELLQEDQERDEQDMVLMMK